MKMTKKRRTYAVNHGQRFGSLKTIKLVYGGALLAPPTNGVYVWGCECDCGGEIFVRSDDLAAGKVKSCNKCAETRYDEPKFDDLTGEVFGNLSILKVVPSRISDVPGRFYEQLYLVECSCGRRFRTRQQGLLEGYRKACKICDPKP